MLHMCQKWDIFLKTSHSQMITNDELDLFILHNYSSFKHGFRSGITFFVLASQCCLLFCFSCVFLDMQGVY